MQLKESEELLDNFQRGAKLDDLILVVVECLLNLQYMIILD
jgi:hypothetical protein